MRSGATSSAGRLKKLSGSASIPPKLAWFLAYGIPYGFKRSAKVRPHTRDCSLTEKPLIDSKKSDDA